MENITSEAIDRRLHMLAEPDYAAFSAKLIPNLNRPLLGVRIPQLRQLAKERSSLPCSTTGPCAT